MHLDVGRSYISKLEADGVRHRDGDGFNIDASRVAYLRFLRRDTLRLTPCQSGIRHTARRRPTFEMRIAEKKRVLIPLEEHTTRFDEMVGLFLSRLSGFAAKCSGRDLQVRRAIDRAVLELRRDLAGTAMRLAAESGETSGDAVS